MTKLSILAVDVLENVHLEYIKSRSINTIVCNESKLKYVPENIQIVNAEIYRIEGTWRAYQFNEAIISKIWSSFSSKFVVDNINIKPAVAKLIYWTNYRIGAIQQCLKANFEGQDIHDLTSYTFSSKLKGIIKYFKLFYENNFKGKSKNFGDLPSFKNNGEVIGILVNNDFELLLYQYIIEELKTQKIVIFHFGEIANDITFHLHENISLIDLSKISYTPKQSFFLPFFRSKEELYVANMIYQNWHNIGSEIARYQYILSTGIKKILINVGENLPFRNLMKPVFGDKVEVFNTMNGIKSGEAHDADINFDKWFVWDNELRDLLVNKCHINRDKLIVAGHLAEDHIRYHKFGNSIQIDTQLIDKNIVISVFSVRGKRKEKVDLFDFLYHKIREAENILLIVKPHPLEKKEDYILPEFDTNRVIFIDESLKNSKPALYDLLHISDLSIVFGSTVALESSWIKTPCITFEYRQTSLIHNIESKYIQHISQIDQLKNQLNVISKKEVNTSSSGTDRVSETIVKKIKN